MPHINGASGQGTELNGKTLDLEKNQGTELPAPDAQIKHPRTHNHEHISHFKAVQLVELGSPSRGGLTPVPALRATAGSLEPSL